MPGGKSRKGKGHGKPGDVMSSMLTDPWQPRPFTSPFGAAAGLQQPLMSGPSPITAPNTGFPRPQVMPNGTPSMPVAPPAAHELGGNPLSDPRTGMQYLAAFGQPGPPSNGPGYGDDTQAGQLPVKGRPAIRPPGPPAATPGIADAGGYGPGGVSMAPGITMDGPQKPVPPNGYSTDTSGIRMSSGTAAAVRGNGMQGSRRAGVA
jgi:hypothetical protein